MVAAVRRCESDPGTWTQHAAAALLFTERHSAPVAIRAWHELLARLAHPLSAPAASPSAPAS
jgi:hypothetical protein